MTKQRQPQAPAAALQPRPHDPEAAEEPVLGSDRPLGPVGVPHGSQARSGRSWEKTILRNSIGSRSTATTATVSKDSNFRIYPAETVARACNPRLFMLLSTSAISSALSPYKSYTIAFK